MNKQEAIKYLNVIWDRYTAEYEIERETLEAYLMARKSLQGDMYCPSCGVRLVSENEYIEPKPYKESEE